MQAIQEEIKSSYRMEIERLADLAFAEIKEDLYKQKPSWEIISHPITDKAQIFEGIVELSLDSVTTRRFKKIVKVYSCGKITKDGTEWRKATFEITFSPIPKRFKLYPKKKFRTFSYQILLEKTSKIEPASIPENSIASL